MWPSHGYIVTVTQYMFTKHETVIVEPQQLTNLLPGYPIVTYAIGGYEVVP